MKNVSQSMRAPWHLLGNVAEWQVATWRRWLLSQMRAAEQSVAEAANGGEPPSPRAAPSPEPPPVPDARLETAAPDRDVVRSEEGDDVSAAERRFSPGAGEARARLEWMCDRLLALEAALDRLERRSTARELEERRADGRGMLLLERVVRTVERQVDGIDGLVESHQLLEQRFSELEKEICRLRLDVRDGQRPPSPARIRRTIPPVSNEVAPAIEFPADPATPSGLRSSESSYIEPLSQDAAGIHGTLGEMSLGTVLAMFEIERRTGVFTLQTDASVATIEIAEGAVVRSSLDDAPIEPVTLLRQALGWSRGAFWFNQRSVALPEVSPRPLGSLLLEATHRNDEAVAR